MKKTKALFALLLALLLLALTACGQSEAAKTADGLIAAIGTVDKNSEAAISAAESAVAALEQKDRDSLKNLPLLEQAKEAYQEALNVEKIQSVEQAIAAIGTVDLNSGKAIAAAREAYDGLEAALQSRVDNLSVLTAAEDAYLEAQANVVREAIAAIGTVDLDSGEAIAAAQAAYSAAPAEVKALVENADEITAAQETLLALQAQEVDAMIAAIGTVTKDSGEAIAAAQAALDALPAGAAAKVSTRDVLAAAAADYQEVMKKEALKMLDAFRVEKDTVRGMSFYYSKTQPYYADTRSYVMPYIGMNNKDQIWLCADLHYTGDDWIFFNKITFAIDDSRTLKLYSRSDLVRDNAYGNVWEYVNTGDGNEYIPIFENIVDSKETIVRFEGDNYYYDLNVSQKDKDAIKSILDAYNALIAAGYKEL